MKVLVQVAEETDAAKREIYGRFLRKQIAAPTLLTMQVQSLDVISRLAPVHIVVLEAIAREPSKRETEEIIGSPGFTLQRRTELSQSDIETAVAELDNMLLTDKLSQRMRVTMRGIGASGLSDSLTRRGKDLVRNLTSS